MKVINIKLTTVYQQLPNERLADVDFIASPTNVGTITLSLHNNPNAIIDKLAAGDSFGRETGFDLNELDAKSSSVDDVLIIRW